MFVQLRKLTSIEETCAREINQVFPHHEFTAISCVIRVDEKWRKTLKNTRNENHINVRWTHFPPKMRQINTKVINQNDELPVRTRNAEIDINNAALANSSDYAPFLYSKTRQQIKFLNITKTT